MDDFLKRRSYRLNVTGIKLSTEMSERDDDSRMSPCQRNKSVSECFVIINQSSIPARKLSDMS